MHQDGEIPYAEPVHTVARRISHDTSTLASRSELVRLPVTQHPPPAVVSRRTDSLAIASAICGFTALVPFVSQVIGLALGAASLIRIRRCRRDGGQVAGTGWAVTGIVSSGITLAGWIAVFVAFHLVGSSFSDSAESLSRLLQAASAGS